MSTVSLNTMQDMRRFEDWSFVLGQELLLKLKLELELELELEVDKELFLLIVCVSPNVCQKKIAASTIRLKTCIL